MYALLGQTIRVFISNRNENETAKVFRRKISVNISCFICIVGCREHGERFGGKEAQGYISSPMNI